MTRYRHTDAALADRFSSETVASITNTRRLIAQMDAETARARKSVENAHAPFA